MELKLGIEIFSDVLGGVSGIALLIPTYRITTARALIAGQLRRVAEQDPTDKEGLSARLRQLESLLAAFDPLDARLLKVGAWTLLASFGTKLLSHAL